MYQEHFGLDKALFAGGIAQDGRVFLGPRQQLVAANLKIALTTRDSIAVLGGPPGVGKTTLTSHALRIATTRLALGWLGSPPLTPHELLEQLLSEFDFSPYKSSRVERLQTWRQFLSEMSITDTRVCVLVENAQDYEIEVLRALESLTAADPNGCPGANVVLTCQSTISALLASPALEALRQRVRLSCRLEPLNEDEAQGYLEHAVTHAGGDFEVMFGPGAVESLRQYSAGVIRVMNNLCETALTVAATRREKQLTPQLVTRVAVGLLGMAPSTVEVSVQESAPAPAPIGLNDKPEPNAQAPEPTRAIETPAPMPAGQAQASRRAAESLEAAPSEEASELEPRAAEVHIDQGSAGPAPDSDLDIDDTAYAALLASTADDADLVLEPDHDDVPTLTDSVAELPSQPIDDDIPILSDDIDLAGDPSDIESSMILAQLPDHDEPPSPAAAANDGPAEHADDEEATRRKDRLEALANAQILEDISNSMAETLFGDAELEQLSATLAVTAPSSGSSDRDRQARGNGEKPSIESAEHESELPRRLRSSVGV